MILLQNWQNISWLLVPKGNHEMRESWIPQTVLRLKSQNGSKSFQKSNFWAFPIEKGIGSINIHQMAISKTTKNTSQFLKISKKKYWKYLWFFLNHEIGGILILKLQNTGIPCISLMLFQLFCGIHIKDKAPLWDGFLDSTIIRNSSY